MQRNSLILSVVAVVAIALGFIWRDRLRSGRVPPILGQMTPRTEMPAIPSPSPVVLNPESPSSANRTSTAPRPNSAALKDVTPTLQEHRDDVRENPHGIPKGLQRFADTLGAFMEQATKDEESARGLLSELTRCVGESEVEAARQTCLVNARRLARIHPNLAGEAAKVEAAASDELKASLQHLGMD